MIFVNYFDEFIIISIILFNIFNKTVAYFDLEDVWHDDCYRDYSHASATEIEGDEDIVSDSLNCDYGNNHCSVALAVTKTYTRSLSIGGGLGSRDFKDQILKVVSASFSISFSEATATGKTYTCNVKEGTKVWLAIRPKFVKVKGLAFQRCCGFAFFGTPDCENTEEGEVDMTTPLVRSDNSIAGEVYCRNAPLPGGPPRKPEAPSQPSPRVCRGANGYSGPYDNWCFNNCKVGYCPPDMCTCS